MTRSGFVAIAGQPNVGKSTILNGLLKEKLAIITPKPETTRDNIRGILTDGDSQIVFIDTPGIHRPHDLLGKIMVTQAQSSILEADMILFVTEKKTIFNRDDELIRSRLPDPENKDKKVILVINKADRIKDKKVLLPVMKEAQDFYPFDDIIPMCALNDKDIDRLLAVIKKYIPEGPFFYPEDQLTDKTEDFMIKEVIREKALELTHEEIPHSIAVVVDDVQHEKDIIRIYANIFVERTSQKPIIVGKNGEMIKHIGQAARKELEVYFDKQVFLDLWVKVHEKWKKDPRALQEFGYAE